MGCSVEINLSWCPAASPVTLVCVPLILLKKFSFTQALGLCHLLKLKLKRRFGGGGFLSELGCWVVCALGLVVERKWSCIRQ